MAVSLAPVTMLELPKAAKALIEHYLHLRIMGVTAACPYHINPGLRSSNRALVGKGRPTEIEATAEGAFKRLHTNISSADSAALKAALQDYGIGIDCSGFSAWVLNEVTLERLGKPIWKCLRFASHSRRVVSTFRPLENISASLLTGPRNSQTISDLKAVRPGDMIRGLGGNHVIVITEVGLDKEGAVTFFGYAHSTTSSSDSGVRRGAVRLTHPHGGLLEQSWSEDCAGEPGALRSVKSGGEDSRVVRLRALT